MMREYCEQVRIVNNYLIIPESLRDARFAPGNSVTVRVVVDEDRRIGMITNSRETLPLLVRDNRVYLQGDDPLEVVSSYDAQITPQWGVQIAPGIMPFGDRCRIIPLFHWLELWNPDDFDPLGGRDFTELHDDMFPDGNPLY